MHPLFDRIDRILMTVNNPGRYAGCEWNIVIKEPGQLRLRIGLVSPDCYESSLEDLELAGLYNLLNQDPEVGAERIFLPDRDMEAALAENGLPLFCLETRTPLRELDVIHFCIRDAITAVNVPAILDMAGIQPLAAERGETDPLILAGGPFAYTPEPLGDFVDLFLIGESEDVLPGFKEKWVEFKEARLGRQDSVLELARTLEGAYAPAYFPPEYDEKGRLKSLAPTHPGLPEQIRSARVLDLDFAPFPLNPVVPGVRTTGGGIHLEIMRGSSQPRKAWGPGSGSGGLHLPPERFRSIEQLVTAMDILFPATGYDDLILMGPHPASHPHLSALLTTIQARFKEIGMHLSIPGLSFRDQVETLAPINEAISRRGKGSTMFRIHPAESSRCIARDTATQTSQDELVLLARKAFNFSPRGLEVQTVIGIPGETEEDVLEIGALARSLSASFRGVNGSPGRVDLWCEAWIPRPHSPLQHERFNKHRELEQKLSLIRKGLARKHAVRFKWKSPAESRLEWFLTRGDRRLGIALLELARSGTRISTRDTRLNAEPILNHLLNHLRKTGGQDLDDQSFSDSKVRDPLPWGHIDTHAHSS